MNQEMKPAELLRSASRLIERALIKLDMTKTTCQSCGDEHYANMEHARLYQQLTDTPSKLERAAAVLEDDPDAIIGRQARAVIDRQIKGSKR